MATNEILTFASTDTGTNLLTQAEYSTDSQRPIGNQPGIARSKLVNKALRQTSLVAAALAEYIAERQGTNVTDGKTVSELEAMLEAAIAAQINASLPETVPPSTIIYVPRSTPPAGYLKANGATVSRTTYAALFAAIGTTFGAGDGSTTFGIPDMRGVFPRGWDDGRGFDSGRGMGSYQNDAFQGFSPGAADAFRTTLGNAAGLTYYNAGGGTVPNQIDWDAVASSPDSWSVGRGYILADGVNGTPRVASETRPKNVALLACIKF